MTVHVAGTSPGLEAVTVTFVESRNARYVNDDALSAAAAGIDTDVGERKPRAGLLARDTEIADACGTGLP